DTREEYASIYQENRHLNPNPIHGPLARLRHPSGGDYLLRFAIGLGREFMRTGTRRHHAIESKADDLGWCCVPLGWGYVTHPCGPLRWGADKNHWGPYNC